MVHRTGNKAQWRNGRMAVVVVVVAVVVVVVEFILLNNNHCSEPETFHFPPLREHYCFSE